MYYFSKPLAYLFTKTARNALNYNSDVNNDFGVWIFLTELPKSFKNSNRRPDEGKAPSLKL